MEVMEEGNLMDRVRILLQRDMAYYQERQSVLHETLCSGVVGGLLDFPHYASFAAYKLVLWWEEEYQAAFRKPSGLLEGGREVALSDPSLDRGCGGVAKTSAPKEFVQLTAESGSQLLEHLHALSQEALDHADLTVLAATLGAAALLRSCLWCYHQLLLKARQSDGGSGLSLHASQKQFHSMAEALAERLLDLHCRLLSLYVLQDSDCLNWENPRAFFEGERGSVTVQMWWLYMQGTRTDLWNTVPPRTAQRVFAGMLNETLTILTVRYATAEPSAARSDLLVTDLSNMLLCTRELAVSVCADAAELVGLSQRTKITRDVHAKCHELLTTLLLRGCPLDALYRVFRRGLSNVGIFSPLERAPAPWVQLVSPQFFRGSPRTYSDLEDGAAISLELSVLLAQPQPSWPLLLRVLMMRNCRVATLLLNHLIAGEPEPDPVPSAATTAKPVPETGAAGSSGGCGRFLCCGDCSVAGRVTASQVEAALVHVVATVGGAKALTVTLLPTLQATGNTRWGHTLDRGQVWNQKRPPWANAIISPLQPMLQATVETLAAAVQDGAAVQDLLQLALSCLVQLAPCVPPWLNAASRALGEQLPADVHPLGESPLLQVVVSALYAGLVASGSDAVSELAEALCRLDDDPLLRPSIQEFLRAVDDYTEDIAWEWRAVEESLPTAELLVSKILLTTTGRQALKVLDQHIHEKAHWVLAAVGREGDCLVLPPRPLLHTMFHIGSRQFDQYLAGSWSPDWAALLRSPLGLSREKVWTQLKRRSEFSDYVSDPDQLSQHDTIVVRTLIDLFSRHEESAAPKVTSTVSKSVSDNSKALTTTIKSKVAEAEAEPSPVQESQTHGERDSRGATDPHPPTASSESSDKTRADSKTEESGSTDTLKKVDFVPDLENGLVNEQNNPSTKRKVKGSSVKSSSQSASASSLKSPSKDSNEEQKSSTTKTPSKAKE